jgi:hypothetical protein
MTNQIKRANYDRPIRERAAMFIAYFLGLAEFAVFILSAGFYIADWRASWLFSYTCEKWMG